MSVRVFLGGLLTTIAAGLGTQLPQDDGSGGETLPTLIFVQAPVLGAGALPARFPQGSRLARLSQAEPGISVTLLTSEFFASADPQISPDGERVLFAAKVSKGSRWQIWEMGTDGSQKRQVTRCKGDCLKPAYLARERIVYTVFSLSARTPSKLLVANLDGSGSHPITFGPASFQLERVLGNGRILASAVSPLESSPPAASLPDFYLLRPDGTGLSSLPGSHPPGPLRVMDVSQSSGPEAEELNDDPLLWVKSFADYRRDGSLTLLARGARQNHSVELSDSVWRSPVRLPNGKLLVSYRSNGNKDFAADTTTERFGLYTLSRSSPSSFQTVFADPEAHCLDAVVVSPRPSPKYFWSVVNPKLKVGYFLGLQSRMAGPEGRELPAPPARVRVLIKGNEYPQRETVGEAPVESDGSFYVAVPADTPVRFQLLDSEGRLLREQKSWIWVRPGERRGCLGCHADRSRTPENAVPKILLRFDVPTPIGPRSTVPAKVPKEAAENR